MYITKRARKLFQEVRQSVQFIPITARTIKSYKILEEGLGFPEFSLVCNGGVLLRNGEVDKDWLQRSQELTEASTEDLRQVEDFLSNRSDIEDVTFEHGFRVYAFSSNPDKVREDLVSQIELKHVEVSCIAKSINIVSKYLTKGYAVKRFKEQFPVEYIIAAGDNAVDVSMQEHADLFLVPESLASELQPSSNTQIIVGVFPDGLLQVVKEFIKSSEGEIKK